MRNPKVEFNTIHVGIEYTIIKVFYYPLFPNLYVVLVEKHAEKMYFCYNIGLNL